MIQIFKDSDALSVAAADLFVQTATDAIQQRGKFAVALTGGSSPDKLYKLLATETYKEKIDWNKVFVFWGDERWVAVSDEKSNAGAAFKVFLDHIPIPENHIFTMWADNIEPQERAKDYEFLLREYLGESGQFDLILSGMGYDGHTASLFPGTAVLHEKQKWVAAYYLEPQKMYRITLTAPVLNNARKNVVLVFGSNKANALYEVIEGDRNFEKYPSQLLNPSTGGELIWMIDGQAAQKLSKASL